MSIYTEMIEYIDEHGIINLRTQPYEENRACCMLGVLSLVTDSEDPYEVDESEVPELIGLSREGLFEEFGPDSIWTEHPKDGYQMIYGYNDAIINGDKEKAIAVLEKAEAIRKANESV